LRIGDARTRKRSLLPPGVLAERLLPTTFPEA
jgi:hypothetical protein